MKTKTIIILGALLLLGLVVGCVTYLRWYGSEVEIRVLQAQRDPSGRWTATVQMEVHDTLSAVDYVNYSVLLKGPAQKDPVGDLVMNVPWGPYPRPSVAWEGAKLIVTLAKQQHYDYFARHVNGVPVELRRN